MGGSGTSNYVYIYNNIIENCTLNSSTTGTFYGINSITSNYNISIYNNEIRNNIKTGTGAFYSIRQYGAVVNAANIYSNIIRNNTNTGAGAVYSIYSNPTSTTITKIYSNSIYSNSTTDNYLYGIYNSSSATSNIYSNSIYSNSNGNSFLYGICNTSTAESNIYTNSIYSNSCTGGNLYGIYSTGSTSSDYYRNNIYDLTNTGASGVCYGFYIYSGTTVNVYNNFVSDLKTPSINSETPIAGIYAVNGTSINLFYNTIFLNSSSSGTNFGSSCIYAEIAPTVDMRNNILVNVSVPNGTGKTTAYKRASNTLTSYSSYSDNNCYYAGKPDASHLIFYDGTNSIQTISNYRTHVTPRDASSFTELPPFKNISTAPYNMHLNTTDTTQCEKGGIPVSSPISITKDYDNGSRNASYPDVGADEYSGIPDLPNISYQNLITTISTSNRKTVNWATISDRSGINTTSGTTPRLYYKKSINDNVYLDNTSTTNGWKWVETSNSTSPFDFTIDYSKLYGGSASNGDEIMYFVVAQDILGVPKLSLKSGEFATQPVSVDLTSSAFPIEGTINSYSIMNTSATPLAGDYTVSLNLFNLITGKNLVPKEFIRKLPKEVANDNTTIGEPDNEDNILNIESGKNITNINTEVEEKYYALSENDVEYKGPTYIEFTPEIRKKFNLQDNYVGNYINISCAVGDLNAVGISASVRFLLLDASYGDTGT
ncbi:MAG: hypothetical protein WC358_10505, partial [Ignavibacteria bacterium]